MSRRICGVETVRGQREESRWPKTHLRWYVAGNLPGVMRDVFRLEAEAAFASWAAVSVLTFEEVTHPNLAEILFHTGRIDGPGRVLAWSEMPPADPVDQKYDFERWSTDGTPAHEQIELRHVIAHELGHAFGLSHDTVNSGSLMAPYYSPRISGPQERDIARIRDLYPGTPAPPPDPDPPPPGNPIVISVWANGRVVIPGYTVTRND